MIIYFSYSLQNNGVVAKAQPQTTMPNLFEPEAHQPLAEINFIITKIFHSTTTLSKTADTERQTRKSQKCRMRIRCRLESPIKTLSLFKKIMTFMLIIPV